MANVDMQNAHQQIETVMSIGSTMISDSRLGYKGNPMHDMNIDA